MDYTLKEDEMGIINSCIDPIKKDNKVMKIPIAVWSRLYLDLEPYLTERDADGVPIITFFQRQLNEVVRGRYALDETND